MDAPRISAPSVWPEAFPPTFTVVTDPGCYYAVELASTAELFDAAGHRERRGASNFFASWQGGTLSSDPHYSPPPAAWRSLSNGGRIYYRAHGSRRQDGWEDHAVSIPDGRSSSAPHVSILPLSLLPADALDEHDAQRVWRSVTGLLERSLGRQEEQEAVICRHNFSPRRPTTQRMLEWIVVLTRKPRGDTSVLTEVLRLEESPLRLLHRQELAGRALPDAPIDAVAATSLLERLPEHVRLWTGRLNVESIGRAGNVLAWQDLAPPPGQTGGSLLLGALTGELLYAATTEWSGGRVLHPEQPG